MHRVGAGGAYHDGRWQAIDPFPLGASPSEVSAVIFDEDGVHAA
ncbi:MAG: hypothetical protein ACLP0J_11010 [Solirubrobacteraceae bacterium]